VFNATFSNIPAISWRPVLVVEEAGLPGKNHHTGGVMVIEDSNYKWVKPKIKMCIGYFHKARSIKD
jgi:hypothetical protein